MHAAFNRTDCFERIMRNLTSASHFAGCCPMSTLVIERRSIRYRDAQTPRSLSP
jgi:hypothetical protein